MNEPVQHPGDSAQIYLNPRVWPPAQHPGDHAQTPNPWSWRGGGVCPTCANHLEVLSRSELTLHVKRNVSSGSKLYIKHNVGLNYPDKCFWVVRCSSARAMVLQGPPDCGKQLVQALIFFFLLAVSPCSFSVILSERTCFNLLPHYTYLPTLLCGAQPLAGCNDSWVSGSQSTGDLL